MKIKSLFLSALLVSTVSGIQAQVVVGPELGVTYSTMDMKINGVNYDNKFVTGARVGAAFDINVDGQYYLQPSVAFGFLHGAEGSYISYHSVSGGVPASERDERSYRLYSVQIPVLFTFKTDFQYSPNNFTFGIGPYVSFNYGGQYSRTYTTTLNGFDRPIYDDRAIKIGQTPVKHDIIMFEIGAMAAVGYEMGNGFNVKLYYGFGFNNVAPDQGSVSNDFRSQGGGLTLSYYINKPERY